jgi:hypothetical protein
MIRAFNAIGIVISAGDLSTSEYHQDVLLVQRVQSATAQPYKPACDTGDGRGGFAMGPTVPWGTGTDKADLNGDGKVDLVTSNSESGTESVADGELPDVVRFTCFSRD